MPHANQHKPCPSEDDIRKPLTYYYQLGLNDVAIAKELKSHYDQGKYGLSAKTIKRLRKKWDLKSTRQQTHSNNELSDRILAIRKQFPNRGAESIRKDLRTKYNMRVPRARIMKYLKETEPDAVLERRCRRTEQNPFYAAGVNEIWVQDQLDDWGDKYGLWLHKSFDPFTGFQNWLRVWWTNRNPRLLAKYYIDAVRNFKVIPATTQSVQGAENYGIANIHTTIRHEFDPSIDDTLQHRWKDVNILSNPNWTVFRRDFAPEYANLFEDGVKRGWYQPSNMLESLVFRWIAIPWLQTQLDGWTLSKNTEPRKRRGAFPQGTPASIRMKPDDYQVNDFTIPIQVDILDWLEEQFAPPDNPVFELTPPTFEERIRAFYVNISRPTVTMDTFWDIYKQLLRQFFDATKFNDADEAIFGREVSDNDELFSILSMHEHTIHSVNKLDKVPLLDGLKEIRDGDKNGEAGGSGPDYSSDDSDADA